MHTAEYRDGAGGRAPVAALWEPATFGFGCEKKKSRPVVRVVLHT